MWTTSGNRSPSCRGDTQAHVRTSQREAWWFINRQFKSLTHQNGSQPKTTSLLLFLAAGKLVWSPMSGGRRETITAEVATVSNIHRCVAHPLLLPTAGKKRYLFFFHPSASTSLRKLRLEKHISRRIKQNQTVQSLQMRVYFKRSWSISQAQWSGGSPTEMDEEELSTLSWSSYASQRSNSSLLSNSPESVSMESYSSGCIDSLNSRSDQITPKASMLMDGAQSLDEDDLACLG